MSGAYSIVQMYIHYVLSILRIYFPTLLQHGKSRLRVVRLDFGMYFIVGEKIIIKNIIVVSDTKYNFKGDYVLIVSFVAGITYVI